MARIVEAICGMLAVGLAFVLCSATLVVSCAVAVLGVSVSALRKSRTKHQDQDVESVLKATPYTSGTGTTNGVSD